MSISTDYKNMIGYNIYYYRLTNNLTQYDLAKLINITPYMVSLWESGKTFPSQKTLSSLSSLFGSNLHIPVASNPFKSARPNT